VEWLDKQHACIKSVKFYFQHHFLQIIH
jgi:hypothetical protein